MKLLSFKYRPLLFVVGFNLFTLLVFLTAPIQWNTGNLPTITLLILISQLAIAAGFAVGCKRSRFYVPRTQVFDHLSPRAQTIIFIICSFTFLLKYGYLLKLPPYDLNGMFTLLLTGFHNPNLGYSLAIDSTLKPTIPWTVYFLISIINQVFFIIGFLCWRKYSVLKKSIFLLFLAAEIFYWMGIGTNFGIISLVTTFTFTQFFRLRVGKLNFTRPLQYTVVLVALCAISFCVFFYNVKARSDFSDLNITQFDLGEAKVDPNSMLVSTLPIPLRDAYLYSVSYLAQGYYHTCLAYDLNFKWTWLLGNNPALISLAEVFGVNVWEDTFVYRLGTMGVDPLVNWHSAYSWFASDVSFFGVPIVLFMIGYFFGYSWGVGFRRDDLLSKIIFVIAANILLYLFANNTYLASMFYSLIFIFPIWFYSRFMLASTHHQ